MDKQKIKSLYNGSAHSKIIEIMSKTNKPMTVEEITKKMNKYYSFSGKTPHKSISSTLQRSIYIKKIERGVYQIR